MIVAIIPARGGSKRIPRKNIRRFLGKPIIAYSIEAALESKLFDEVMVSTDDEEIAAIAQKYGAKVPFLRSSSTANDTATTFAVLEEVLSCYAQEGKEIAVACCMYPCAPFTTGEQLIETYNKLQATGIDSVFPVVEFEAPIQRALQIRDNKTYFSLPEYANTRSQELTKYYHDAGQFYWFKTANVLAAKTLITPNSASIIVSALEAQDIDTETDWKLAELKFNLTRNDIPY
jgi:pseudaminic acid cytidylyltransferase